MQEPNRKSFALRPSSAIPSFQESNRKSFALRPSFAIPKIENSPNNQENFSSILKKTFNRGNSFKLDDTQINISNADISIISNKNRQSMRMSHKYDSNDMNFNDFNDSTQNSPNSKKFILNRIESIKDTNDDQSSQTASKFYLGIDNELKLDFEVNNSSLIQIPSPINKRQNKGDSITNLRPQSAGSKRQYFSSKKPEVAATSKNTESFNAAINSVKKRTQVLKQLGTVSNPARPWDLVKFMVDYNRDNLRIRKHQFYHPSYKSQNQSKANISPKNTLITELVDKPNSILQASMNVQSLIPNIAVNVTKTDKTDADIINNHVSSQSVKGKRPLTAPLRQSNVGVEIEEQSNIEKIRSQLRSKNEYKDLINETFKYDKDLIKTAARLFPAAPTKKHSENKSEEYIKALSGGHQRPSKSISSFLLKMGNSNGGRKYSVGGLPIKNK